MSGPEVTPEAVAKIRRQSRPDPMVGPWERHFNYKQIGVLLAALRRLGRILRPGNVITNAEMEEARALCRAAEPE